MGQKTNQKQTLQKLKTTQKKQTTQKHSKTKLAYYDTQPVWAHSITLPSPTRQHKLTEATSTIQL